MYLIYNESKLNEIDRKIKENKKREIVGRQVYLKFLKSQVHFGDLVQSGKAEDIEKYTGFLDSMEVMLTAITPIVQDGQNVLPARKSQLGRSIDSIHIWIDKGYLNDWHLDSTLFGFKEFDYKDVVKSIEVIPYTEIDSIEMKKLILRGEDAIAGKVYVQKEKHDIMMNITYGDKIFKGDLEEQFINAFKWANRYYLKKMTDITTSLIKANKDRGYLIRLNDKVINASDSLMEAYDGTIDDFYDYLEHEYNEQSYRSKIIRYGIVILLMILMFIVLAYMTKNTYDYERKLQIANENNIKNLNFKNRILGILSHELKSPLTIISILINNMLKSIKDKVIREKLKAIDFTANSLLLQASQTLEYTKDQDKKDELKIFRFDLNDELMKLMGIIRQHVENKGNKFIVINNLKRNYTVHSDKVKLQQLFLNIVGNANKYTDRGKIEVDMKVDELGESRINFRVRVSDSGTGISNQDLKKIFEPNYQGIVSDDVENLGAGLGLYLCKEIVDLFNGHIAVFSRENTGTTMIFNVLMEIE